MNRYQFFRVWVVVLLFVSAWFIPDLVKGQSQSLKFKTRAGNLITVSNGLIKYNGMIIKHIAYAEDILATSKMNRIIEDGGAVFLFLAMDGRPNLDRYNIYKITRSGAKMVADAMLSPVKDYHHDGHLEFGGSDLTEGYPNPDSMYYIPTAYFEISNGEIHRDKALTIQKDKEINGLYLPLNKQLDKEGNCCVVIPDPSNKGKKTFKKESPYLEKSYLPSDTTTVLATSYVLSGQDAITDAVHNADGTWEFFSDNRTYTTETAVRKTKLGVLVKLDPSVLLLCWLQKGYFATRRFKDAPWVSDKLKSKE